jgi:hypothetical protein
MTACNIHPVKCSLVGVYDEQRNLGQRAGHDVEQHNRANLDHLATNRTEEAAQRSLAVAADALSTLCKHRFWSCS